MKILKKSNKRRVYGIQWECYNCLSQMEAAPSEIPLDEAGGCDDIVDAIRRDGFSGYVNLRCPVCGEVNRLECTNLRLNEYYEELPMVGEL